MYKLNQVTRLALVGFVLTLAQFAPTVRAVEIINLRSGFDEVNNIPLANGFPDTNISQVSNSAGSPLTGAAFTASVFNAARTGGSAAVTAPHSAYLAPALFPDPQARWINWTGNLTPRSVMYAMPFTVTTPGITSATLNFTWCVDDGLGDAVTPNPAGLYLGMGTAAGAATTPMISGGAYATASSASRTITGQIQTGTNYLYLYQSDVGAVASGTIFSATITVLPEPATLGVATVIATTLLLRRPFRSRTHSKTGH